MKAIWLLEEGIFDDNLLAIKEAIKACNRNYYSMRYAPFEGLKFPTDSSALSSGNDCVISYGSLQFAKEVQRKTRWVPGSYCQFDRFECMHYYPRIQKYLLNSRCIMLPYGMLLSQKDFLFECLGNNNCLFMRPSSGFKIFTGQVVQKESYEKDITMMGFYDVEPEKIVIVAEPKNIQREWRLVIVDQWVIASSLYKENNQLVIREGSPVEVQHFGELVAHQWEPERAWVMDIAQTYDNALHVLEIGGFSCSGLYACNIMETVQAVSECAEKEWGDIYDSRT